MKLNNIFFSILFLSAFVGCSREAIIVDSVEMEKIFFNAQSLAAEKNGFPCVYVEDDVSEELRSWFVDAHVDEITNYTQDKNLLSVYFQLKNNEDANFFIEIKLKNNSTDIECFDLIQIYR